MIAVGTTVTRALGGRLSEWPAGSLAGAYQFIYLSGLPMASGGWFDHQFPFAEIELADVGECASGTEAVIGLV